MSAFHSRADAELRAYRLPDIQARNAKLASEIFEAWRKRRGMRLGDFIVTKDGVLRRFCNDMGDTIQPTLWEHSGSFAVMLDGRASFSGGLDIPIPKEKIEQTGEMRDGEFWFFSEGSGAKHNAVYFTMPCRVYREI